MKTTYEYFFAAIFATAGAVSGQTVQTGGIEYQQAISVGPGVGGAVMRTFPMLGPELNLQTVAGSPFSADRETHSLQVLGDGTRIERTETSRYYRDSQGRTRIETGAPGSGRVMIHDPVGGFTVALDAAAKTAQKMSSPQMPKVLAGSAANGAGPVTAIAVNSDIPERQPLTENLGTQTFGGTTAAGRGTTLTIAAGEIGNDRAIQVVSETWYSNDLQMVVRSSNSDPRFGDTTFELTNISRDEPDPALFRIPADYVVSEAKLPALRATLPKE